MTIQTLPVVLTGLRVLGYAGFVLWAGPLVFWTLVWPDGRAHRPLVRLAGIGAGALILVTVAEPVLRLTVGRAPLGEVAPPLAGAAVLVRVAVLVGSLCYLADLVAGAVVGGRRAVALAAVGVLAATVAVQPVVLGQPGPLLAALGTAGHLLAAAAWLGGLVALATVVRPGVGTTETSGLITRFAPVATLGLVLLVLASGATVLAGAGSGGALADQRAGPALLVRIGLLAAVLVIAWYAHHAAARLAFRRLFSPLGASAAVRDRTLTLVVGTQLAIAFGAISAAVLVAVTG